MKISTSAVLLAAAVLVGAGLACTGQIGSNDASGSPTAGTPEQPSIAGARRVRRLSNREYNNVVHDLLGDVTHPADKFIVDSYTSGFDNGSADLTVQSDQARTYQAAAESLAATAVVTHPEVLLGDCTVAKQGEAACIDAFFASFPKRAFRRPPTARELERLRKVYDAGSKVGGFTVGLQTAVEAVLQSPAFLYREELGDSDAPTNTGTVRLNDFELASELSFLLTGSMPDAQLFAAAEKGNMHTVEDVQREGARLLETPMARENLRQFIHQWLATDRLHTLTKDPVLYPSFTAALGDDMANELNLFIDDVMWNGQGSLKQLFSSTTGFVNAPLATLYETTVSGSGFQQLALDESTRKGIMTRAGYLAVHSAPDSSSPITRGVFVRGSLLCAPLPPPPLDVLQRSKSIPRDPKQTTRQRYSQHNSDPFCQGCHQFIDGVGFGFEQFDGIGAHRLSENGTLVDTSGTVKGTDDIDGAFTGASELSMKLIGSRQFASCFVRQIFRFSVGRSESAGDKPVLDVLSRDFTVTTKVQNLILSVAKSPAFFERSFEGN